MRLPVFGHEFRSFSCNAAFAHDVHLNHTYTRMHVHRTRAPFCALRLARTCAVLARKLARVAPHQRPHAEFNVYTPPTKKPHTHTSFCSNDRIKR